MRKNTNVVTAEYLVIQDVLVTKKCFKRWLKKVISRLAIKNRINLNKKNWGKVQTYI